MVCSSEGLVDQKTLKQVVKSVVEEEDRSRNIIIFGLPEENEEYVCERVQESFSLLCQQILSQAKKL
jgi:hypothetical protein